LPVDAEPGEGSASQYWPCDSSLQVRRSIDLHSSSVFSCTEAMQVLKKKKKKKLRVPFTFLVQALDCFWQYIGLFLAATTIDCIRNFSSLQNILLEMWMRLHQMSRAAFLLTCNLGGCFSWHYGCMSSISSLTWWLAPMDFWLLLYAAIPL
jgi:hypothetical protein